MDVYVRRQFETDDQAEPMSLDTFDELLALMTDRQSSEARILYAGLGMPVLIELPATAAAKSRLKEEVDQRSSKRMDLNRMAKHLKPMHPEEWMTAEQLAHYRATGDMDWHNYGTKDDRRFGLG